MKTTKRKPLLYIVQPDFPVTDEGMQESSSYKVNEDPGGQQYATPSETEERVELEKKEEAVGVDNDQQEHRQKRKSANQATHHPIIPSIPTKQSNEASSKPPEGSRMEHATTDRKSGTRKRTQFKQLSIPEKIAFLNRQRKVSKPLCEITTEEETIRGHVIDAEGDTVTLRKMNGLKSDISLEAIQSVKLIGF
ncbi:hypothetical protein G4V62_14815 [Bacillaceae bacterium SIJ1]|uniref:CotO family spore coat protein n=1 Tax=Litoribacterium kuwaitense TaxID=1398745 RepID=UPI0013EA8A77|nr:CotO family spore coat protein [Litoribacterium kuwaitense]NGP46158.1 hypothetical protein [Litoribacterium kuwaitense]